MPRALGTWSASPVAILLVSWAAIGFGAAANNGAFTPGSAILVTIGGGALLLGAGTRAFVGPPALAGVKAAGAVAVASVLATTLLYPAGLYGSGALLTASRVLIFGAASVVAYWVASRWSSWNSTAAIVVFGLVAAAGIAMVASSPRPLIDDWFMLQASGSALSGGRDIYLAHWVGPPGEASNLFAYLPGSAVFVWPFHVLFGDVRYGIASALVVTAALLAWEGRGGPASVVACLFLVYPGATFGLEQSWIDPLVVLGVVATAVLVQRGQPGWAVVALAGTLACKQQAWLVLPAALLWKDFGWRRALGAAAAAVAFVAPWAAVDPESFYQDVFVYQLHLAPRIDSLSLPTVALRHGVNLGLTPLVLLTALAVALLIWRLPRDTVGFLVGSAMVLAAFNLGNKQTFFNEWELCAGLILAAAVFALKPVSVVSGDL